MNGSRVMARIAGIGICGQMHTQVYLDRRRQILRGCKTGMCSQMIWPYFSKAHEEVLRVIGGLHRNDPLEEPQNRVLLRLDVHLARPYELVRHVDQEGPEDVDQPGEVRQQGHRGGDEDASQDDRPHDPVEEHPLLVHRRDGEVLEDHQEHEEVVHAQ